MSGSEIYPPLPAYEEPPSYDQAMEEAIGPLSLASISNEAGPSEAASRGPPVGYTIPRAPVQDHVCPVQPDGPLTYVNFTQGTFNSLIQQANDWLQQHLEYRVVTCETVELPRDNDGYSFGDATTVTNLSAFYLRVASNVQFIRIFRLWLTPSPQGAAWKPQRIAYSDVVPKRKLQQLSFFGRDKFEFETMQDTLFRYNEVLKAEPLPGRVFNVQSLDVRFREKAQPGFEKFNENYFTWVREKGDSPDYFFLHFLRVYYDESMNESTAAISQIGFRDFVPKQYDDAKSAKDFESLKIASHRIHNWLNENPEVEVTNIQTLEYCFCKPPSSRFLASTDEALFKDCDTGDQRSLKFLRLYYLRYLHTGASCHRAPRRTDLTYKTFSPATIALQTKMEPERFENSKEAWTRATAWLQLSGARVFCAETVLIRKYPFEGQTMLQEPSVQDATYRDNRSSNWQELWVVTHRVHLDGIYMEPPAHLLPPLPSLPQDTSSCTIL